MNLLKKSLIVVFCMSIQCSTFANVAWKNDLRTKFLDNKAVITEINIRSFNANDIDGDGFIEESKGETKGNFLNAVDRLDELKNLGINTLHVLPVTPVGKTKALGTAGSLYSAAGFDTVSEDLADKNSKMSAEEQFKNFIDAAHSKNIRVIVDIPACGSYDLYLQRPDLFVTDASGKPVIPSDWTDVRLLATGTEEKLDTNVYNLYKDFVKKMISFGVDGIRADVAHSKTALFWKELINYSREKDPEFMWLAEVSDSWHDSISEYGVFTSYDKLLDAGFDGFYGSFFNLKNWKTAKEFHNQIKKTIAQTQNCKSKKSVIGAFTTHDEVSPILLNGKNFSKMIVWLNSTLPVNTYYVDGFQTGDDYLYKNGNKAAPLTNTDDDIYFTHRGKIDIFNFSRKPEGKFPDIKKDIILGNNVKNGAIDLINNNNYTEINTKNPYVFGYSFGDKTRKIITVGNLDFSSAQKITIKIGKHSNLLPIKVTDVPSVKHGKFSTSLHPGEIVVIITSEEN